MRLVRTDSIKKGSVLAQTIYNEKGTPLIRQGVKLSERMIHRLRSLNIGFVYIDDELTEGIIAESSIPNDVRVEAIQEIKTLFTELSEADLSERSYLLSEKNHKLTSIIEGIVDEINGKEEAISMLADMLVADNYTFQHSLNVALYSIALGKSLQFNQRKLNELGIGAVLHDIGKVFIDDKILLKPGRLTDEEFKTMQAHTELGFNFLREKTDLPSVIAHCAYQHHERLDGSGYPRQLVGDEIHEYAQIIGIADVFDAVTSERVYRRALLPHQGLEILYADAVHKFDRNFVELFKKSIIVYPNGITVELNDGRKGIVSKQNKHICDRPIVRIFEEHGKETTPYEINLAKLQNIIVENSYMA
ncbi:MAG TPA: HD-GYP domain-containing protein [Bacillota bacterium]|nr:HD-GYP domain-containing protein [Bacillota bacterium]